MKISTYLFFMTSIVSFSASEAGNDVPNDDQLLLVSCQALTSNPEQEGAKPSICYIQKFLAGVLVTDTVIGTHMSKESSQSTLFIERAYGTRLDKKIEPTSPTGSTYFCLPEEVSEVRIARKLSKLQSSPIDTTKVLRDRIHNALKAEYPCG